MTLQSNRELLELAAKAAGYATNHKWNESLSVLDGDAAGIVIDGLSASWNPLTDDGDALLLLASLRLDILFNDQLEEVWVRRKNDAGLFELYGVVSYDAPLKPTPAIIRHAIVLAAASLPVVADKNLDSVCYREQ